MRLDFNDGKYTYILHDDGTQEALRYGEPWRKLIGNNLIYWMGVEVHNLRTKNAALRAEVERLKAHQCTPVCVFHEGEELRKLCEQLAASQLEAKRIREQRDLAASALSFYMDHGICEATYYNVREALAAIKESET